MNAASGQCQMLCCNFGEVCVLGAVAAAARWFGTEILELTAMDDGHKPRVTAVVGLNLIHCAFDGSVHCRGCGKLCKYLCLDLNLER